MDNFKQRNVGTKKCNVNVNATNGKTQTIDRNRYFIKAINYRDCINLYI